MKTIIIATDFSAAAKNAAFYAAEMAMTTDATLLLFHVYQIPTGYYEIPIITEFEIDSNAKKTLSQLKDELIARTNDELKINTMAIPGNFYHELKIVCEKIKPYTVVMGSQGTTSAEHIIFGSHTVEAMKHLKWPLITVPLAAKFSQIKKIGLACDFDEVIESTPVDEINKLVNDFNAELHVIYSGKTASYGPEMISESGMLQEMLAGFSPIYHFITSSNTDEGIISFVEKNNIDLLITLPKRHRILRNLIHRSISKQLILHIQVPVFAFQSI